MSVKKITRRQLRQIVKEEVGRLVEAPRKGGKKAASGEQKSYNDWRNELDKVLDETGYGSISDTPAFNNLSSENQAAEEAANDILYQFYTEGMSEQDAADKLESEAEFWEGVDLDDLAAEDHERDDAECEDCSGSGDCSECSEDGTDTNTGETCENCGGTHECPSCNGSGDADPHADD